MMESDSPTDIIVRTSSGVTGFAASCALMLKISVASPAQRARAISLFRIMGVPRRIIRTRTATAKDEQVRSLRVNHTPVEQLVPTITLRYRTAATLDDVATLYL